MSDGSAEQLAGGCACGAVRYRLASAPMFVNCCHCLDCQRQTGAAFAINAIIETDRILLDKGRPIQVTLPTDSGFPHDVYRCEVCQTAVWSDYGRRKVTSFVRVGTLDTPSAITPDAHIFTRTKVPWVALPADVPAFEVYYKAAELWPEESLQRRKAVSG
jgi:hypothetical protein